MSFVARRFGSAGLVPVTAGEAPPPAPSPSGVSLRSPVIVVVGVDDVTARACKTAALQGDVGFVRAAQGIAACRAIRDARPTVVALGASLWRDETYAIAEVARSAGARVVQIPAGAPAERVAIELTLAAMLDAPAATAPAATG